MNNLPKVTQVVSGRIYVDLISNLTLLYPCHEVSENIVHSRMILLDEKMSAWWKKQTYRLDLKLMQTNDAIHPRRK